jgi:hypothetical protein
MKRLWRAPGVMTAALLIALSMVWTARKVGLDSPHFWWSLLICLIVLALALAFRWFTDPKLGSNGSPRSNQKPSGLN